MLDAILQLAREFFFFAGYVSGSGSFPPQLPPEEEKNLIAKLSQGDPEARSKLIEHNLRLVAHIAKKYGAPRRDTDDLISIGTVGLIKAVSSFKPDKGNTLATYAARCIENEILMSLRSEKKLAGEVSFSDPIGVDKDGNEISLAEVLGSDAEDVQRQVELTLFGIQLREVMDRVLSRRERTVIELRYGLTGGHVMPQREIAKLLGISRSYVSRHGYCKRVKRMNCVNEFDRTVRRKVYFKQIQGLRPAKKPANHVKTGRRKRPVFSALYRQ